jgi:hypothetical protein
MDVKSVIPKDDFTLVVEFKDGRKGVCDFSRYLAHPAYAELKDINVFKNCTIESGILTWASGTIDIAPETLYFDTLGLPYPEWLAG